MIDCTTVNWQMRHVQGHREEKDATTRHFSLVKTAQTSDKKFFPSPSNSIIQIIWISRGAKHESLLSNFKQPGPEKLGNGLKTVLDWFHVVSDVNTVTAVQSTNHNIMENVHSTYCCSARTASLCYVLYHTMTHNIRSMILTELCINRTRKNRVHKKSGATKRSNWL